MRVKGEGVIESMKKVHEGGCVRNCVRRMRGGGDVWEGWGMRERGSDAFMPVSCAFECNVRAHIHACIQRLTIAGVAMVLR